MWKTALILIISIIIVPFVAFTFDQPLSEDQKTILLKLIVIYLVAAISCFIISSLSRNYSQVDKLWSIMPVVYTWIITCGSGFEPRIFLMAILVTIWGIRLTYNFSRRGGYSIKFWSGNEDYRWSILRARPEFAARWKWILFNFLFISLYQMGLLLLLSLPALKSMEGKLLSWIDYLLAALVILFLIVETIADHQQWEYQKQKKTLGGNSSNLPGKFKKGFIDYGLWGIVRHPNYASEQAIWIILYFYSVAATGVWINWSAIGACLLILLFKGSSDLSESISSAKYPEYTEYKKNVPRFIPFL